MSTQGDDTFCHQLPVSVGDSAFCGLTKKWPTGFNQPTWLVGMIVIVVGYWIILLVFVKDLYRTLMDVRRLALKKLQKSMKRKKRRIEKEEVFETIENVLCYSPCCVIHKDDPARLVLYISIVVMVLLKYFWDGIDFTLDLYIVYRQRRNY